MSRHCWEKRIVSPIESNLSDGEFDTNPSLAVQRSCNLPTVTAIVAVMNSLLRRLDLDGGITDLLCCSQWMIPWPGHQSWFKNPLHWNFASVCRIINRIWVLTSAATVYTPLTRCRERFPKSCCLAVSIEQSFPLTGDTWPEKQWYSSHKTIAAFIKAETVKCYTWGKYIDRRMQG